MSTPNLDLYEVAYLAGGPDRVVDTAVVALVRSGRVRVHSAGQLATVGPVPPAPGRGRRPGRRKPHGTPFGRHDPLAIAR